jgi:hypothetical protein
MSKIVLFRRKHSTTSTYSSCSKPRTQTDPDEISSIVIGKLILYQKEKRVLEMFGRVRRKEKQNPPAIIDRIIPFIFAMGQSKLDPRADI